MYACQLLCNYKCSNQRCGEMLIKGSDVMMFQACVSQLWGLNHIMTGWNRFCRTSARGSASCYVYITLSNLTNGATRVPCCVVHGANRGLWSLTVQTRRHGSNSEVRALDCNTQRLTRARSKTYTMHKTCEGERQQARWHVKLPRWCIA